MLRIDIPVLTSRFRVLDICAPANTEPAGFLDQSVPASRLIRGAKKTPVSPLTSSSLINGVRRSTLMSILFSSASMTLCSREIGSTFGAASGLVLAGAASAGIGSQIHGHKAAITAKEARIQGEADVHMI